MAEGERQATILNAEADRQAAILNAEGFARALGEISQAANQIDSQTLTLQYLETLKALGAGAASKFIIPLEFVKLAQPLMARAEEALAEPPSRS